VCDGARGLQIKGFLVLQDGEKRKTEGSILEARRKESNAWLLAIKDNVVSESISINLLGECETR
jgi:hypothetical protein